MRLNRRTMPLPQWGQLAFVLGLLPRVFLNNTGRAVSFLSGLLLGLGITLMLGGIYRARCKAAV